MASSFLDRLNHLTVGNFLATAIRLLAKFWISVRLAISILARLAIPIQVCLAHGDPDSGSPGIPFMARLTISILARQAIRFLARLAIPFLARLLACPARKFRDCF